MEQKPPADTPRPLGWLKKIAVVVAAMVALTLAAAGPAAATQQWKSASAPLTITGYGSTGKAYGSWDVRDLSSGTKSYAYGYQKIDNADDHKVYYQLATYVAANWCVDVVYASDCGGWWLTATNTTAHTSSSSWNYESTTTRVSSQSAAARALMDVRIDVPFREDPRSGRVYTGVEQY
jgi:hypothetical protein